MRLDLQRTIVALSSGAMPGRRAIVRMSGQQTANILRKLLSRDDLRLFESQRAVVCDTRLLLPWPGERSIEAKVYYWPDQRSYTGQSSAELHLLGSMPVVEAIVEQLCSFGASPAERGEFTLRSFLAGKIDLPQAEAVLGVIEADNDRELQQALGQLAGDLSVPVRELRTQLIELLAHLEAGLDFVDEDIEFITAAALREQLRTIEEKLNTIYERLETRDARQPSIRAMLVGLPNAGKSSLFNQLVGSERAIIAPVAGTTRDVITQSVNWQGQQIEFADTAGLEELDDHSPRAIAQDVLQVRLKQTDCVLFCIDTSQTICLDWFQTQFDRLSIGGRLVMVVGTKADLASRLTNSKVPFEILVSNLQPDSILKLRELLAKRLAEVVEHHQSQALQQTALRCRTSLEQAIATVRQAIELSQTNAGEELVAGELRIALDDLSSVVGEIHSDDILSEIFNRFCIGK